MYINLIFIALLSIIATPVTANKNHSMLSDDFIDHINKKGKWRAGRNFPPDTPIGDIKLIMSGVKLKDPDTWKMPIIVHNRQLIDSLPDSFDPRKKWPGCPSLDEIRDQGRCGACWAFGAVEAMTDRVCTYSNGTQRFHFSAEDLLACSNYGGCKGGDPYSAWKYWVSDGLVSGGNYDTHLGCMPYSIAKCKHHMSNCTEYISTPTCKRSCAKGYSKSYKNDKRYGKICYKVAGEKNMMAELYKNGPIEVNIAVYEDFATYRKGVYEHIAGNRISTHSVKMLGWGKEGGKKYWLLANSWGTGFGEKGYFKMLRGVNECLIESLGIAGAPKL